MTVPLRPRHLLLTTGLTLLLGACSAAPATAPVSSAVATPAGGPASTPGAAGSTTPAAGGSDPCRLLTKPEVEAAFGETMLAPVSSTVTGEPACTYQHAAGLQDLTVGISSRLSSVAGLKSAEAGSGAAAKDVPGIGDAAFEVDVAGVTTLEFVKGTTLVNLNTFDIPAIISVDNFHTLAKKAAGRI